MTVNDVRSELLVAIRKNNSFNIYDVAHTALYAERTAINGRRYGLNDDPPLRRQSIG